MKSTMLTCMTAMSLFAALAVRAPLAAQELQQQEQKKDHHHYKLIDLGTFGGPASYFSNGFDGILNNHGIAVGWADTSAPDPFPMFCFNPTSTNCFVAHAFQWKDGRPNRFGRAARRRASSQCDLDRQQRSDRRQLPERRARSSVYRLGRISRRDLERRQPHRPRNSGRRIREFHG